MADKRKALGKGLAALLKDPRTEIENANQPGAEEVVGSIAEIPVQSVQPNPFQPRTFFDDEALQELADSIQQLGVIQPITVRRLSSDSYELISGERRWRASKLAGLTAIPAYIRLADDQGMLEMALVENIQREELDAVEVALSYQRLMDECSITQEQMSKRVGKKRSTVSNYIRLLKLPPIIQAGIRDRMLSMGHARALVSIESEENQLKMYKEIISSGMSVRQVEEKAKALQYPSLPEKTKEEKQASPFNELGKQLGTLLETEVVLKSDPKGKGEIVIRFKNPEELERLISILNP